MRRYCVEGAGTGRPGVPTDAGAAGPGALLARARPPIDFAGGIAANAILVGWKPLTSAGFAIVSAAASALMYCERLPGFGWLLIHCGALLPFFSASRWIVSNIRASARGS